VRHRASDFARWNRAAAPKISGSRISKQIARDGMKDLTLSLARA